MLGREFPGVGPRIAAQMQSIDELRHATTQIHAISHYNMYFEGMADFPCLFDRAWYLSIPKSFFEDACTSGPFKFIVAVSFAFEYVLTNLAFILDLLAGGCELPIILVYGQRSRAELYYHEEFQALAAAHANFTYVPALSHEPAESDWDGFRGFVHDAARALRQRLSRPQGRSLRPSADDRRVHHGADPGPAVRKGHLHREISLGGRRTAGAQSLVPQDLNLHPSVARSEAAHPSTGSGRTAAGT